MISTTLSAAKICNTQIIALGRQMEDNYRQIIFDVSDFTETITSITLVHQRKGDTAPYIVGTGSGTSFAWTITDTDTAYAGYGKGELRISFANGLAKSIVFRTLVIKSITADTTIPAPLQSWYDAMIDYIDEHSISPEELGAAIEAYIEEHPIEAPVTSVNTQTGDVVLTASDVGAYALPSGGIPKTDLAAAVQTSLGKADTALQTAPVTSVNTQTGDVVITAAGLGAITTETDPIFVASAAYGISSSDISSWNGKYTKPASGIPATDLTSTVQSRLLKTGGSTGQVLAKASGTNYDVAWTTVSGGGAVDSVNGKTGAVTLTASDVGALSSSTTFVSSFNGSSGAVTYTAPVTSVNTRTGAVTGLAEAWTIENKTNADTSVTLTTGKFYIFPEMSTLTVTVTNTGMYAFRFTSGTTATTLTVTGATMPDSFTVEASKVYEVNIYQGYAVVSSWTAS